MIKKLILGIFIILFLLILGIVIFENLQKPQISYTLSDRSKEFIKKQRTQDSGGEYTALVGKKGEDYKGKRVKVGECFSFIMPYSVFNSRQESECGGYFAFDRPRGSITAFMEQASSDSIDSAPGVSMRRQDKEKYQEKEYKIGQKQFVGFIDKTDIYTITIYHYVSEKYLIFTLKLSRENDEDLRKILSSLEFY
jgi:hypothetical protein